MTTLTFVPMPDPAHDPRGLSPESAYSRLAWLPTVGPSSWLIWGTLAGQLRRAPSVKWELATLARMHGLATGEGKNGIARRSLSRLCGFGLLDKQADADFYLVRLCAPPLSAGRLVKLPPFVTALHNTAWDTQIVHPALLLDAQPA